MIIALASPHVATSLDDGLERTKRLLSEASAQEVRVNYQLTGLFAVEGKDYTGTSGTVTFAPGETSKDLNIPVISDLLDEVE